MIKSIVTNRNELSFICKDVYFIGELGEVIQDLKDTASSLQNCIGLAAPQIGHKVRVILIGVNQPSIIMVNPVIVRNGGQRLLGNEGCLSIPSTVKENVRVRRWYKVRVRYATIDGVGVIKTFKSFEGRVVQHEIDHLNGVLIK